MSMIVFESYGKKRDVSLRGIVDAANRTAATLRDAPRQQYLLRAAIATLAVVVIAVAADVTDLRMIPAEAVGLIGAAMAAVAPRGYGSAVVLVAAIGAWLTRYGVHDPSPIARTVAVAALLYLVTSATALAAAMPVTARYDRRVITRWCTHIAITLAVFAGLAALVYTVGELPASRLLEFAGLAAIIIPVSILTRIARRRA